MAKKTPTSRWGRVARLGGLTTRVTASYLSNRLVGAFQDEEKRKESLKLAHIENAERIAETMGILKGAAMKVGQTIAVLADGTDLPPEVARILGKLHDSGAPIEFEIIREDVEKELGGTLEELFLEFDPVPLGSASLGQAHAAKMLDGTDVVVKVLHRGIEQSVDSDLKAMQSLMKASRLIKRDQEEVEQVFIEIRDRLVEELDYYKEAANLEYFHTQLKDMDGIRIPSHFPSHSTGSVLTMSRLHGVHIQTFLENSTPEARRRAGLSLIRVFHEMAYRLRTLHADPHPGNYLFEEDGTVGLLDFGCVKRLDLYFMADYSRIARAGIAEDRKTTLEMAHNLGVIKGDALDPEAEDLFWQLCQILTVPFRGGVYRCGVSEDNLLKQIQKIAPQFLRFPQIQSPKETIYLHRALAGVYQMARKLELEMDFNALFQEYSEHAIGVAEGRIQE
jgi:predicted unusual protein kinase regulating ubiquinone biosynthesis (AarF/ABC1/UbiB family)